LDASSVKVLMIDDETDLLDVSKQFLELDDCLSVDTARSAAEALSTIRQQEYDVIVSDYQMPGRDGIELLKDIRATENYIPFILFTGKGREEVAIEALNNGADFYLQKGGDPASQFAELSNMIKQAYSRKESEQTLRISEERYRSLFENSIDAVMLTTIDGRVLTANPSACRMLGLTESEIKMVDGAGIVIEDKKWEIEHRNLIQNGISKGEVFFRRKDGTTFIGEATSGLLTDRDGNLRVSVIIRDITERKSNEEKLRISETRYRRLFETAQDGILIIDYITEKIIDANKFLLNLTGYSLDATLGKSLWELGFIEDKALAERAFSDLKTNGYVRYENIPLRKKNGEILPVEFVSNVYQVNGSFVIQCNIRDISDRRLGDRRKMELARIVESTNDAVIEEGVNGIITTWNSGAERIFGYCKEEVTGHSISLLTAPGSKDDMKELANRVVRGEMVTHYETICVAKSGKQINTRLTLSPLIDAQGRIIGVSTIANDITEHKLADKVLRESEERLQTYLDNSPEGIFIIDAMGNFVDVNKTAGSMINYSREEMLDLNLADIIDERMLKEGLSGFQQLKDDGAVNLETLFVRKDGARIPIFLNGARLPNERYLAFCTDISERKRVEEALGQTKMKLNLLSSITRHDINNQVSLLIGNLTMLKTEQSGISMDSHLLQAEAAAERISSIVKFTKEYEEFGAHDPVWQDIRGLVRTSSEGVQLENVRVVNDVPIGTDVFADPLITKVFYNLMANAVRHGGGITAIHFSLGEVEGGWAVVCEDDGDGMSMETKEKLFTRGIGRDHGLGLFLSREILSITGINIKETSEPGSGARFVMTVPRNALRRIKRNGHEES